MQWKGGGGGGLDVGKRKPGTESSSQFVSFIQRESTAAGLATKQSQCARKTLDHHQGRFLLGRRADNSVSSGCRVGFSIVDRDDAWIVPDKVGVERTERD